MPPHQLTTFLTMVIKFNFFFGKIGVLSPKTKTKQHYIIGASRPLCYQLEVEEKSHEEGFLYCELPKA